jgi:hypothetical protein
MQKNLDLLGGLVHSQRVLIALTPEGRRARGRLRLVQRNAMKVWQGEGDFLRCSRRTRTCASTSARRSSRPISTSASPQARRHHLRARIRQGRLISLAALAVTPGRAPRERAQNSRTAALNSLRPLPVHKAAAPGIDGASRKFFMPARTSGLSGYGSFAPQMPSTGRSSSPKGRDEIGHRGAKLAACRGDIPRADGSRTSAPPSRAAASRPG